MIEQPNFKYAWIANNRSRSSLSARRDQVDRQPCASYTVLYVGVEWTVSRLAEAVVHGIDLVRNVCEGVSRLSVIRQASIHRHTSGISIWLFSLGCSIPG